MIDLKFVRDHPETVQESLKRRGMPESLVEKLLEIDESWRLLFKKQNDLKAEQNRRSEAIARQKRDGEDASSELEELRTMADRIKALSSSLKEKEEELNRMMEKFPNLLHHSVPLGRDEKDNRQVRSWGIVRQFDFKPRAHWEIAEQLKLIDLDRGSKIAGSGFILYRGWGARLERALINWMIDYHLQHHAYEEIFPPFLVNRETAYGTGKLPDFEGQMYRCENSDLYLNPTAEVPVTSIYRNEVLDFERLPLYFVAYTACFRREAGAAGKDTRGLLRVHQFDKVELVKIVAPEKSFAELEKLLGEAEDILRALELPYEVLELCGGELGFVAAKAYDLNVYAPGVEKWLEVSSCSNCTDFQARRLNIRFRNPETGKLEFVHTLNGSGVALPRTVAAILENYQEEDGSVRVPGVLVPYMGTKIIAPQ